MSVPQARKEDDPVVREWTRIFGPAVLLAVLALVIAWQFVAPAPPKRVVMATGQHGGAYALFGERYREELARHGVTVELRETQGSVENLRLLQDPASRVDIALLQGGIEPDPKAKIRALASVFVEPLWLFTRMIVPPDRLTSFRKLRVAVGPEGSGTRAIMLKLLAANGLDPAQMSLLPLSGENAVAALAEDKVEVVALVASAQSPLVTKLAALPRVKLISLDRAPGYEQKLRYLRAVTLHEGVLDFGRDVPAQDTHMVAPVAALVARRDDFHPALVDLFLEAAQEIHGDGDLFSPPRAFPAPEHPQIPTIHGARQYLEHGPGFLRRYLPFWAATLIERSILIILPLLTLLLPFLRILPPAIDWRIRSRAFRWYKELREIEHEAGSAPSSALAGLHTRLDALEARLRDLKMPLSRNNLVYDLRQHLDYVRAKLDRQRPPFRDAA